MAKLLVSLFRSFVAALRRKAPPTLSAPSIIPEPPLPAVVTDLPQPPEDEPSPTPKVTGPVWPSPPPGDVWPEVRRRFQAFSGAREGRKACMYLDTHEPRGLVTFGTGNLLSRWEDATRYAWKRPDGTLASREEIRAAWEAVDARQDLKHSPFSVWLTVTDLRVDEATLDRAFWSAFEGFVKGLVKNWPDFFSWPAPAQFALLSWAWGHGTDPSDYPKMNAALKARDFATASREVAFDEKKTKGVRERNIANRDLLEEAAIVVATHDDPSVIRTKV